MDDIQELRRKIDSLDGDIKKLFLQRMDVCRDVGRYKLAHGLPVLDATREAELLAGKAQGLEDKDRDTVIRLFKSIMDISKEEQSQLIGSTDAVAYCGTKGAYTYFAAKSLSSVEPTSYSSFKAVVSAVESGEASIGVLPIENTTSGSVLEVYDLLGDSSVFIVGETVVPIHHCILSSGTKEQIKTVLSHPQALSQCSKFLSAHGFKLTQSVNTAIAARECAKANDPTLGVIASRECGELYDLSVLWESVEDRLGNKTRFVIISKDRNTGGGNKACLTFTLPHRQGSLLELLNRFSSVNLTKIESRPVGDFEYRFYLDFISDNPNELLSQITTDYNTIKVLGVFPSYSPLS